MERPLEQYPRPSVAVDTALLTVDADRLSVLLVRHPEGDRLPGTFLHEGETLAEAVIRSLRDKAGVTGLAPTQLRVFDAPDRDPRGRVLSVAHVDVVPARDLVTDPERARLSPVDALPALPWDHEDIVRAAVALLRAEYADGPDPRRLLDGDFTLRELRDVHDAVAGERALPDAFRRRMLPHLAEAEGVGLGRVGKPAQLYRLATEA
jgi:8-oxo-dGTP diphosphatase